MKRILVVIPTYNECANIQFVVKAVLAAGLQYEVLIVDDNSPDGTGQIADDLSAQESRIHVLHRPYKEGLGKAYLAAFQWALSRPYEYIFEMDADFSHDPKYLTHFLEAMEQGADLCLGSRRIKGGGVLDWGLGRKLLSAGGSFYARLILGIDVRDLTSGFKCFHRKVLESINLNEVKSSGYAFQIELTYRAILKGFKVLEVPIIFEDRRIGKSKMSRKIFLEAVFMVWRLRFGGLLGRIAT